MRPSRFRHGRYVGYEVGLEIRRHKRSRLPVTLDGPQQVYDFIRDLRRESSEYAYALLCDTQHRLQGVYLAGKGGCSSAMVDPKEMYKAALVTNSPALIFVHNHPSGVVGPSMEDAALSRRLQEGAQLQGLCFVDRIIVADRGFYSFKEGGTLW